MFGGANWCLSVRHLTSGPRCSIVLNPVVIWPSARLVCAAVVMDPVASPLSVYSLPSFMFLVDWQSIACAAFALGWSCPGCIQPVTDGREVLATSFDPCHQSKQAIGPGLVWVKKGQAQQEVEANTNFISHSLRFNFISLQTPKSVIFCFITQMLSCHLDVSFSLKSAGLPPSVARLPPPVCLNAGYPQKMQLRKSFPFSSLVHPLKYSTLYWSATELSTLQFGFSFL